MMFGNVLMGKPTDRIVQYQTYEKNITEIKGPDNPTSQLLPIRSNKCCSGTGKEGKTKEVVKDCV
jgi:hypothetical protein